MRIRVIGAGVAGLTAALEFARAGCFVELVERREGPGLGCSFLAGGMIAPWCEAESAEPLVVDLGIESLNYWTQIVPVALKRGSLVIAPARDRPELTRFSRRTREFERIGAARIAELEPDLAGRFDDALFFPREAHLDPRAAVAALFDRLKAMDNVALRFGVDAAQAEDDVDWTIDCRGFDAKDALPDLRGVKGEMLVLFTKEVRLSRPVRLIHPRNPVYIVPRGDGRFMIGATMIENHEAGRVTARAMLELLGAAYAVHPAFGEAEIVETGAGVRPAFFDNLPRIRLDNRTIHMNGLYRHGFLLAPALAMRAVDVALRGADAAEILHEDRSERQDA
ncbi:FAD-dependent oxidoreductase [Methylocella silvestris]|uniref:FAD-dependent oxidoreductase n=1 Tax=Methylocella silvestris TaxID=199596 RepID=A0A2J7TK67_METSI|nr:FAD-dependent oxidoreductase [Methylocella silvestris]PNG27155.1 FAD-dependent oxidoreductase [Methylocella silvestris]